MRMGWKRRCSRWRRLSLAASSVSLAASAFILVRHLYVREAPPQKRKTQQGAPARQQEAQRVGLLFSSTKTTTDSCARMRLVA
ncbi:hypothetical protein K505DRAFT_15943 [Melanomma pulvis-pyrius CBS 109.77]|uniref:Uncharacterized protein n=1 Tax=Melanomma pulvis-pyrius CBS 109.77 TaxID=1314802 RepID=A0A6A6WNM3_9PLEO|nr:hypothetical protein K505DRAFT_15943 [Melanomma pulvis-pyrius CBS 109.77]